MRTIKDLIKELKTYDQNLPVTVTYSFIDHSCGSDGYCYCSSREEESSFYIADKLDIKKKLIGISLVAN